jgi:hypothetical protein
VVDDVQDLDHVLLLARRVGRYRADIVEVHPPLHTWLHGFQRFMLARFLSGNAMVLI